MLNDAGREGYIPVFADRAAEHTASLSTMLATVYYAFQPIVCARSGRCFGIEALLRGHETLGFSAIAAFFDHVWRAGALPQVEAALQEKAVATIAETLKRTGSRLFFNLDNRNLQVRGDASTRLQSLLAENGLDPMALCLEISERHALSGPGRSAEALKAHRRGGHLLALDDFGSGYSGMQILYEHQPDIVKIDRFFISGLCQDERKRLFVGTIVNLAHTLGIKVVAEGVETEAEFRACVQIGCDLIQGYYIARPSADLSVLTEHYPVVADANRRERRDQTGDQALMRDELVAMPALSLSDSMTTVFDVFRANPTCTFLPVLDRRRYPVGVVFDKHIKSYTYSRFGKDLLQNKACGRGLSHFLSSAMACDINTDAERVLAMYANAAEPAPILVTESFQYAGVLRPESLLKIINEKNVTSARNQNPLTRLPGNNPVSDYILDALDDEPGDYCMVYFDLDNFKPFNDIFGFRQGDRAILVFSDILRSTLQLPNVFVGHIGGDDFFAGFKGFDADRMGGLVRTILSSFSQSILSFYDAETREAGFITAKGRDGQPARFPLLGCSAAVVHLLAGPRVITIDQITSLIAEIKKQAKNAPDHVFCHRVEGG